MARLFSSATVKRESSWRQAIFPVALFLLVAALFFWGLSDIDRVTEEERLRSVNRAVTKAVVQCYAVEGQYPASYGYLRDHYGLYVDEEKYIVHLEFFGGNMMPNIKVLNRQF